MRRKLDQDPLAGHLQNVDARIDDAIRKLQPVLAWTAGAKFDKNHDDALKTIRREMKQVVFTKLGNPDVGSPCLGLHDLGIETTKASRQFTLLGALILSRQIQMQIRHRFLRISF